MLLLVRSQRTYGVESWEDPEDFLTQLAQKSGRLGKGGEPDINAIAKSVLNVCGPLSVFLAANLTSHRRTGSEGVFPTLLDHPKPHYQTKQQILFQPMLPLQKMQLSLLRPEVKVRSCARFAA